jgi:hypothetical protein
VGDDTVVEDLPGVQGGSGPPPSSYPDATVDGQGASSDASSDALDATSPDAADAPAADAAIDATSPDAGPDASDAGTSADAGDAD